jgi:hypothetical protein
MKRRRALSVLASVPWCAQAQQPRARVKPPVAPSAPSAASLAVAEAMAGDVELIREILATLHPGQLRYNSPLQLDAAMAPFRRAYTAAPDVAQRYLALSRFLAMLKCGHTHANAFNQSPAVAAELFDRRTRLPLTTRWIGEQMIVTSSSASPERLPPGTWIGAVNDVPTARMLQTLLPATRADGSNDAKRRSLLAIRARAPLETFDVLQGVVYGEPPGGVHKLDVRTPDGTISSVEVPALTLAERHAQVPAPAADGALWDWRIDDNGVAVLTMPTWALHGSAWDWRAWLSERLDLLATDTAAKALVVDLRGNEGGLDCGHLVLERFLSADSTLAMRRLVRFQSAPAHLNRYLDTWDESVRQLGAKARRFDSRFFALPEGEATLRPSGARLLLPLLVLVDWANSAATFSFAQRVKAAKVGRLVGETTGGNQRGHNGGAFFFVRLPASGLEFDLPLIGTFPLQPAPDAGLEPDVKVDVTAADIAAGRDAVMERALALARG